MNIRFTHLVILPAALAMALTACTPASRPTPVVGFRTNSSPTAAQRTAPAGMPAETESGGDALASKAEADERPGLGTVFGETRRSPVRDTTFIRASSAPFIRLAMMYNDSRGVQAQLAVRGGGERVDSERTAGPGGFKVALLDHWGRRLETRAAGGRLYVVGEVGQRYAIQLKNPTPERLEVVATVDGLDVIDGKPAAMSKRGYVLDPGESMVIDGFRLSMDNVAAFRFGKVKDSYAARTSGDRNVGVIGVALFQERGARWSWGEVKRRESANPFPGEAGFSKPPRGW